MISVILAERRAFLGLLCANNIMLSQWLRAAMNKLLSQCFAETMNLCVNSVPRKVRQESLHFTGHAFSVISDSEKPESSIKIFEEFEK